MGRRDFVQEKDIPPAALVTDKSNVWSMSYIAAWSFALVASFKYLHLQSGHQLLTSLAILAFVQLLPRLLYLFHQTRASFSLDTVEWKAVALLGGLQLSACWLTNSALAATDLECFATVKVQPAFSVYISKSYTSCIGFGSHSGYPSHVLANTESPPGDISSTSSDAGYGNWRSLLRLCLIFRLQSLVSAVTLSACGPCRCRKSTIHSNSSSKPKYSSGNYCSQLDMLSSCCCFLLATSRDYFQ